MRMSQLWGELDQSQHREKEIQRPRGEKGLGVLEKQKGGQCGWSTESQEEIVVT